MYIARPALAYCVETVLAAATAVRYALLCCEQFQARKSPGAKKALPKSRLPYTCCGRYMSNGSEIKCCLIARIPLDVTNNDPAPYLVQVTLTKPGKYLIYGADANRPFSIK